MDDFKRFLGMKIIVVAILLLSIGVAIWLYPSKRIPLRECVFFPRESSVQSNVLSHDLMIAHAGGAIDGDKYTNSLEAVKQSIVKGYKFIELDLLITKDDKIVAAHDWRSFNRITGHQHLDHQVLSLNEFRSRKINSKYTPLSYIEINEIFAANPSLILVTDKIKDFKKLVATFKFADRMIVEVFSIKDYQRALAAGVKYPMLSLRSKDLNDVTKIISQGINMVVSPSANINQFPQQFEKLHHKNICIFVFTSNEEQFIHTALKNKIATAFYTDFWDLDKNQCSSQKELCNTY